MRKPCLTRLLLATQISLLLLVAGCRSSRPDTRSVFVLDNNHVKVWSKAEALSIPALSNQATKCRSHVTVASDVGFELMYGLDVRPYAEPKK